MGLKRKATTWTKRPYKKQKKFTSSYTRLATGPKTLVRKLRYVTRTSIDAGAVGAASNLWIRANGMFDPEVAIGGHQPLGFDQYMALYDHFKVVKSKISVTFLQSTSPRIIGSIYLDDDTTANLDIGNMIEQGLTSWAVVASGDVKPTTISKWFVSKDFFSGKQHSAELLGSDTSDPAEGAFFNISVAGLDPAADPASTNVLIVVDYYVSFSERTTLVSS